MTGPSKGPSKGPGKGLGKGLGKDLDKGEARRIKLVAGWALLAPVGAMALVVATGAGSTANTFVVDAQALSEPRRDAVFDGLAQKVPDQPGVDGSVGSEKPSSVEVPVIGSTQGQDTPVAGAAGSVDGIPGTVLAAYQKAARDVAAARPGCGLTWPLLAGIGKVESAHASGGRVDASGRTRGEILGPVLDGGPGMAAISDTDQGRFDGNAQWDRAVGPMQFIPGTWAGFGADGNGDGVKDPHNVYDAARAAGEYLCAGDSALGTPSGLVSAVLRYNHSMDYVSTVVRWMRSYSGSTVATPDDAGAIAPPADRAGNVQPGGDPVGGQVADGTGDDALRAGSPLPSQPAPGTVTAPGTGGTRRPAGPPPATSAPTTPPATGPGVVLPTTPRPTARPPWTISPKPPTKPVPPTMTPTTPPTTTPPTSPPTTTPGTPETPGTPSPTPTPTSTPTPGPASGTTTAPGSAAPSGS